jgi:hypothetical protein
MTFPEDGARDGSWDNMPGEGGSLVDGHPFVAKRGVWWERCDTCGLARAAHKTSANAAPPPDDEELPHGSTHDVNMLELNVMKMHAEGGGHAHPDAT